MPVKVSSSSFGGANVAQQGVVHFVWVESFVERLRYGYHILKEPNSLTLRKMIKLGLVVHVGHVSVPSKGLVGA